MSDKLRKLNLGAGKDIKEGFDNHDIFKRWGVNMVFDLNKYPYPIKNNTYDYVLCKQILMYIKDLPRFFKELYRISGNNCIIDIENDHKSADLNGSSIFLHHYFALGSLDELEGLAETHYKRIGNFKILGKKLLFRDTEASPFMRSLSKPITKFFNKTYKRQLLAERFVSKILYFSTVCYKLKVVKEESLKKMM